MYVHICIYTLVFSSSVLVKEFVSYKFYKNHSKSQYNNLAPTEPMQNKLYVEQVRVSNMPQILENPYEFPNSRGNGI